MAQESCNLDKDDAELLKPSSSASATTAAPPPPAAAPSSAMFHISTSSQEQHHQLQQQQQQQQLVPRTDAPKNPDPPTNSSSSSFTRKRKLESPPPPEPDASSPVALPGCDVKAQKTESTPDAPAAARTVNRCSCCQKRVGLTGFRCRCGDLFCAAHRYSDAHGCSFDYKAAGRAEISKANPVVRAPKIIKI